MHACIDGVVMVAMQPMVDKLKGISSIATLVTTKHGHMHLEAAAPSVHVAAELQGLGVLPSSIPQSAQPLTCGPPVLAPIMPMRVQVPLWVCMVHVHCVSGICLWRLA